MSGISEALRRLTIQNETTLRSPLAYPIDPKRECKRLGEIARDFAIRAGDVRPQKGLPDPKRVWTTWAAAGFDLSTLDPRQIKALCLSPETAVAPELVKALHRDGELLRNTACLMGLVSSYFARWGVIRQQEQMEDLIRKALRFYTRRHPTALEYREHASQLFSPSAAQTLAAEALHAREPAVAVLNRFRIAHSSNLAANIRSAAVREFLSRSHQVMNTTEPPHWMEYALSSLLVPELPAKDFYSAVSALIVHEWTDKYATCQDSLRRFVLHHRNLGDPRLNSANWAGMEKASAERFLSWIAKENIIFFFNHVLPDNNVNRRRKYFWLHFVSCVKDFQVALSATDYRRLLAASRLSDVPGFARVSHETTSAFIMRFGVSHGNDIIIVEFSETGNAAHKFDARTFEIKAGNLRTIRFEFGPLKHHADENRIIHRGERWEYTAYQRMAEWGARP